MTERPVNRFLREEDYRSVALAGLRKEFERIYGEVLGKKAEAFGARDPKKTRIHWSRDWEYPWAILSSEVRSGDKVLDCGCGGSPLLPFLSEFGCEAYGVDLEVFKDPSFSRYAFTLAKRTAYSMLFRPNKLRELKDIAGSLRRPDNLWSYRRDPNELGFKIRFKDESLDRLSFGDATFDRVYCISVIEHLPTEVALRGMKEMARVLKPGGLLTMTVDNDGDHVNPELVNGFQKLIAASGLALHGASDFTVPPPKEVPGTYNVVGFVLRKK